MALDHVAVLALYYTTNGTGWENNSGWLITDDHCDGTWYGVNCGADGRVYGLFLYGNQLSGPIPAELGNLSALQVLDLSSNQLSRPIPAELGNFSALWFLDLQRQMGAEGPLTCWETPELLAWAQDVAYQYWFDPPGTTICQP